ncbi:MAG: CFI-box-CTERM domain-containing protein [Myxococcaceae bacterium]|nr:CFI-box-CTERM domain-containing protein [Myxococcaceae bacterium]
MANEPAPMTPAKPRSVADGVAASRARARGLAGQLPHVPGDVSELLRADAVAFCARAPEPPVYRRRDDPTKAQAQGLIDEAERLLARALHSNDQPWVAALEAWLVTLHQLAQGQVEAAEASWAEAQRLERLATGRRRLFAVSDERPPPVFDPKTRQSRFDPRAEKSVQVKLPCPSCRKVSEFSFSPRSAEHAYACTHCANEFSAYVAEVRSVEIARAGTRRRYAFRLSELSGLSTRLDVEDASAAELQVARNDLLAFLYQPRSVLRGVLNLSSSRVLWVSSSGPCFVATVAFGDGAPELDVLRRFRDEVLLPRAAGRLFVRTYYAAGPALAQVVRAVPGASALTRRVLSSVVRRLEREHQAPRWGERATWRRGRELEPGWSVARGNGLPVSDGDGVPQARRVGPEGLGEPAPGAAAFTNESFGARAVSTTSSAVLASPVALGASREETHAAVQPPQARTSLQQATRRQAESGSNVVQDLGCSHRARAIGESFEPSPARRSTRVGPAADAERPTPGATRPSLRSTELP